MQTSTKSESPFGYPSHFVPPSTKRTDPEWSRKYLQSIDAEAAKGDGGHIFRAKSADYADWRAYARGDQSIDQYKKLLLNPRHKRQGGKNNRDKYSYKNLDWSILSVAPKFVNVLVGRLIGQDNSIGVRAIDPKAVNARRQKKISMQEYILNQDFLKKVSENTGIKFESPLEESEIPPPTNFAEVQMHMDMFYKEHYCLELMDMLNLLNAQDDYVELLKTVAVDLVEVGVGATKTYRIGNRIKRRRCIPERMVTNNCRKEDFSDFQHGGEYWDLTIGELRELAGNQLTEEQYREIAEGVEHKKFDMDANTYFAQNHCYPYDHVRVTILDAVWFSPDQETHQEKLNKFGNITVYEKPHDWMGHVSTDEFNNSPINKANGSRIIRRTLNNLYQGMLVVGTKHIFNWGLCKDMLRNESDIGTAIGPFTIYSLKFDSLMRQLKPVFDSIQRNWLQYQHHINKSRPAGLEIEYSALQEVNIGGKGGTKMSPREVLELYFDTGILLWKRRDWSGQANNWRPINELQNGLSAAAAQHFTNIVNEIELLRTMVGLTDVASAETPNAETGAKVTEIASGAVDDAVRYIHHGFDQINIGTCKRTVMHISAMAMNGMAPDYTEALGLESMAFMASMADIGAHEYGIYLIKENSREMKAELAYQINEAQRAGTLLPEEAYEIKMEKNPYRAIKLLKMYRLQKERKQMEQTQAQIKMQEDAQINSAKAAEAERRETLQFEYQLKGDFEYNKARANGVSQRQATADNILLEKVKQNGKLSEGEQKRATELLKIDAQGEWDMLLQEKKLQEADIKAKAAAKKPAAKK